MKLGIVYGTRPELIKVMPIYFEAMRRPGLSPVLISTGQHKSLLEQGQEIFQITPAVALDVMSPNQSLSDLSAILMKRCTECFEQHAPDVVIVQGDTTTAFISSLAASYLHIPVCHVEAGLRTYDRRNPFPEEMNRTLIGQIANHHFPPTERAENNLINEGVAPGCITRVGNTIVDSIEYIKSTFAGDAIPKKTKTIIVTLHRRENFGEPLVSICDGVARLADTVPDTEIIFPVHPNPNVKSVVHEALRDRDNVNLVEPLNYVSLLNTMSKASLIISDSGGIQEEAPSFNVPILICRETTERPEVVEAGLGCLVGSNSDKLYTKALEWLANPPDYSNRVNPFGDGLASKRILDQIEKKFG